MARFKTLLTNVVLLIAVCSVLPGCVHQKKRRQHHIFCSAKQDYALGLYHEAFNKVMYLSYRGHTPAQYALGRMYYYGTGIVQDTNQGRMWIRIAAMKHFWPAVEAMSLIHDGTSPQYTTLEPGMNGRRWAENDQDQPGAKPKSQLAQQKNATTQLTEKQGKHSMFTNQLGANQIQQPANKNKRTLMGTRTPQRPVGKVANVQLPLPDQMQLAKQTESSEDYHVTSRRFTVLPAGKVKAARAQAVVAHNSKQQQFSNMKTYLHQRAAAKRQLSKSPAYLSQTFRQAQQKLQTKMRVASASHVKHHPHQHSQQLAQQITTHHAKHKTSVRDWNKIHYSHHDKATNRRIFQEMYEGQFDMRSSHQHPERVAHKKAGLPVPAILEKNSEYLERHVVPVPRVQASAGNYSNNNEINL